MFTVGFSGSPRKKGNTATLLKLFMEELGQRGSVTRIVDIPGSDISPCTGCGYCEKKGICSIRDEMSGILTLMRRADIIVIASPVYFFGISSQLKMMIDRTQTFWSRIYRLKIKDPKHLYRKGILLSAGGSGGKNLFDGIRLTARYFFDAAGAEFSGDLVYRNMEYPGDILKHDYLKTDIRQFVDSKLGGLFGRDRSILFIGKSNTGMSFAAAVMAMREAGDRVHIDSCGIKPGECVNEKLINMFAEQGLDAGFILPKSLDDALAERVPGLVVLVNGVELPARLSSILSMELKISDIDETSSEAIGKIYDELKTEVIRIVNSYTAEHL